MWHLIHLIYNFHAKAASAVNVAIWPAGSSTLYFSFNVLRRHPIVYQGLSPCSSTFPVQPVWTLDILTASTMAQHSSPEGSCSVFKRALVRVSASVQSIAAPQARQERDRVSIRHRFDANPAGPQASWASSRFITPGFMHRSCTSAGPPHLRCVNRQRF